MKKDFIKYTMKKLTIILYLLLFSLISAMLFINHFEHTLGKELINCGENQIRYLTTIVMNNSIRKYLKEEKKDYLIKEKNEKGEITYISYNIKNINEATTKITQILENDLHNMMKGNFKDINLNLDKITKDYYEKIEDGVILTVSLGTATGSSLLTNIGPKIPLKLKLVGEVTTTIEPNIKEYGLNNAMIEIYAKIKETTTIQMPFLSKNVTIENKIPLSMEIIQGNIPEYYIDKKN